MAKPTEVVNDTEAIDASPTATPHPMRKAAPAAQWVDNRVGAATALKSVLRKVFPDHWSFLLGEIALFSFIILLLTGVFLTLWFKPSMAETHYHGTYELMHNIPMSEAYASTLNISFDVRGGLLMRQIHHWAALIFVAAAVAHLLRVFFTGAFRRPREINWLIGVGLLSMAMVEGFAGYSLPDDLLSGTGLRFVDGMIRSVPIIGTWAEFFIFNGEYPGDVIIPRLYMAHILLIPGLLLGLLVAHMGLVVYHKHTQYPGPGRTNRNVVGYPMFPVYAAKAGGFMFIVFGILAIMGATMQINPLWQYGPYNPAQVTAGSQPDWYMGPAEGAVRLMPGWETHIFGTTWSWNVLIPGAGTLGVLFTALALYPFLERWFTGDSREHHLLDRPRNAPTRTALGVAAMSAYAVLWLAGGNDILATQFRMSINAITIVLRVALFVVPVIAFIVTRRICLSLQRADRERSLHGSESGTMMMTPDGEFGEGHEPVSDEELYTLTQHEAIPALEESDGSGNTPKVSGFRARMSRWFNRGYVEPATASEIEAAHHHDESHAVDGSETSELESSGKH